MDLAGFLFLFFIIKGPPATSIDAFLYEDPMASTINAFFLWM